MAVVCLCCNHVCDTRLCLLHGQGRITVMVWEKERVLETEALWTMVFESEIEKYAYLDYPDWCVEATKELGLFTENSIYLHMICRENIDSSEYMLRRFLKSSSGASIRGYDLAVASLMNWWKYLLCPFVFQM